MERPCSRCGLIHLTEECPENKNDFVKGFYSGFHIGVRAQRQSNNHSGCCCEIDDDGETIISLCAAHKAYHDSILEEKPDPNIEPPEYDVVSEGMKIPDENIMVRLFKRMMKKGE